MIDTTATHLLGRTLSKLSIATNPPCRIATGAMRPVSHNIKNLAASSGQGKALFSTYRQKTCNRMIKTINARAKIER